MFYDYVMKNLVDNQLDCGVLGKIHIADADEKALQIIDMLVEKRFSPQEILSFVGSSVWGKDIAPNLGDNAEIVALNVFWWVLTFCIDIGGGNDTRGIADNQNPV